MRKQTELLDYTSLLPSLRALSILEEKSATFDDLLHAIKKGRTAVLSNTVATFRITADTHVLTDLMKVLAVDVAPRRENTLIVTASLYAWRRYLAHALKRPYHGFHERTCIAKSILDALANIYPSIFSKEVLRIKERSFPPEEETRVCAARVH